MCHIFILTSPHFTIIQQDTPYYLYFTNEEIVAQEIKRFYQGPYRGEAGSRNLVVLTPNVVITPSCRYVVLPHHKSSPQHKLVN